MLSSQQVNKSVFETVQKYNGPISAAHGVGVTKKPYLHYTRSPEEIVYMQAIKKVFDPNNIINPGKIFDPKKIGPKQNIVLS